MAKTVLVCGKTGTGKTTAVRTLNPEETVILRVIKRTLPFKHTGKFVEGRNLFYTPTYEEVLKLLDRINKGLKIKNLVITDATYLMRQEFIKRAKEVGYTKFSDMAQHMQSLLVSIQNAREDLKVFLEFHVDMDDSNSSYKAATVGKLLDEKYNIFENIDIILFASPMYEDKESKYGFYTNHTLDRAGLEIPAKSPMGMFDELYIPNDLAFVAQKIEEYYSE